MFDIFKLIEKEREKKGDVFTNSSVEYIIAGLGNPGLKYENTRHNAGFIAMDNICSDFELRKFKALAKIDTLFGKKVLLLKPQTFMNCSGESLTEAMSFYKILPQKTIIMFDDISLPVGRLRIRRKGSHGGHNGMKNIINLSGSDNFPRIKIGVGAKPERWDLVDWVLSKFNNEERKDLDIAVGNARLALEDMLNNRIDSAMNKFN